MTRQTWFLLTLLFVLLIIGSYFYNLKNKKITISPVPTSTPIPTLETPISATFNCPNNAYIQAKFYNDNPSHVELILSDGRNLSLPQAVSASGARYTNANETFVFWNKGDSAFIDENGKRTFDNCQTTSAESKPTSTSLANPASVNCANKGGQLQIKTRPDGGEYGLCFFDDNRACEEWAMLHGDCPVGGRKTTGYDTEAQKFCAWSGGQTLATENAVCTFNDGSTCSVEDFYNNTCQEGIE